MTKELMIEAIYEKIDGKYKCKECDCRNDIVMIGDILDYIENDFVNASNGLIIGFDLLYTNISTLNLFNKWNLKRKPIEEQSEDTIRYIYNLIK